MKTTIKEITDILNGYEFKIDVYQSDTEIKKAIEFITAYNNKGSF